VYAGRCLYDSGKIHISFDVICTVYVISVYVLIGQ